MCHAFARCRFITGSTSNDCFGPHYAHSKTFRCIPSFYTDYMVDSARRRPKGLKAVHRHAPVKWLAVNSRQICNIYKSTTKYLPSFLHSFPYPKRTPKTTKCALNEHSSHLFNPNTKTPPTRSYKHPVHTEQQLLFLPNTKLTRNPPPLPLHRLLLRRQNPAHTANSSSHRVIAA